MSAILTTHIRIDERGVAYIDDTRFKVKQVVLDHRAWGLTPQQIVEEHYSLLSLAQVHAALAYYYDNQAMIDSEIERDIKEYEELRAKSLDSPGRQKLRAKGLIP